MSNSTNEEQVRRLFKGAEEVILAGGNRRAIPTQEAVIEVIGLAAEAARHEGYTEAMKDVEENINAKAMADAAADHSTLYTPKPAEAAPGALPTEGPIHVSLLMNVDQDKAKGSFMLHDWIDIDGMDFQSAVRVADHCFKLAVVELRQALRA